MHAHPNYYIKHFSLEYNKNFPTIIKKFPPEYKKISPQV